MRDVREAIAEGYKTLEQAFHRGDARSISPLYTEDAELLIPEAPPFIGRAAITEVWKAIVGSGGNTLRVTVGEVQELTADWAYEIGSFAATSPDGNVLNAGKYIVIWTRTLNDWKIHRDVFNWDIPPATV
jgi:ketosteroid isomerase-like protein